MEITIAKVVQLEQLWMAKDEAMVYFGYRLHKPVFQKLLSEFKNHETFKKGYRLTTAGVPIIRVDLFDKFLEWREEIKFKRIKKKITL